MDLTNVVTSLYQAAISQGIAPGHRALPFIIAAGPRSGSTLLQTLLHSHRNAVCMRELLIKSGGTPQFYRYNLGRREKLIQMREETIDAFLNAVLRDPQPPWVRAVGFKAMYVQPRDENERRSTWKTLGQVPNLRVVWLSRNPVRRVISFAIARETGKWVGEKTTEAIHLDPDYLPRRLSFEEREAEAARKRMKGCKIIDVEFESLTKAPEVSLREIQNFLGLPVRSLHTSLTPQNPRTLREMVANFGEVEDALTGTKWEESLMEAMSHQPRTL